MCLARLVACNRAAACRSRHAGPPCSVPGSSAEGAITERRAGRRCAPARRRSARRWYRPRPSTCAIAPSPRDPPRASGSANASCPSVGAFMPCSPLAFPIFSVSFHPTPRGCKVRRQIERPGAAARGDAQPQDGGDAGAGVRVGPALRAADRHAQRMAGRAQGRARRTIGVLSWIGRPMPSNSCGPRWSIARGCR